MVEAAEATAPFLPLSKDRQGLAPLLLALWLCLTRVFFPDQWAHPTALPHHSPLYPAVYPDTMVLPQLLAPSLLHIFQPSPLFQEPSLVFLPHPPLLHPPHLFIQV